MGKVREKAAPGGLAGALFTPVQRRVLGLLFGQPERAFSSSELIRQTDSGTGATHRQLQRLERVGLVTASRVGNQKHYRANRASPVFSELHGIVLKTVGLAEPLRAVLAPFAKKIAFAFVFGSVAKGSESAGSDVDLLVVSDELTHVDLYAALESVERTLARPVNPIVMSRDDWRRKRSGRDSFAKRVAGQPKMFLIENENAFA